MCTYLKCQPGDLLRFETMRQPDAAIHCPSINFRALAQT
ncbi:hypothetical protein [Bradyrhizobium sp. I1.14.4]